MNRRTSAAGYTLIEVLVVIVLIVILMTIMSVILIRVVERAKYSATIAIIKSVDLGCRSYKQETGRLPNSGTYPPNGAADSSKGLHELLGAVLQIPTGYQNTGGGPTPPPRAVGPLVRFEPNWLEGTGAVTPTPARRVVDGWGRRLYYLNPGVKVPDAGDLWSAGAQDSGTNQLEWVGNWEQHTVQ